MSPSAFVIDDELFIALEIEDYLVNLGFKILGPVFDLSSGLKMIESVLETPDVALMDINIGHKMVWPLARLLRDAGTKVIFVSANHSHKELEAEFKGCPVLDKPVSQERIAEAIKSVRLDRK